MKVFLANLPWRKGARYGIRAGSRWPFTSIIESGRKIPGYMPFPFFLGYAAAVLEKNNINVILVDALGDGLNDEEFLKKVLDFKPDIFVFETSTPSIYNDLKWARSLKDKLKNLIFIICGPHATVFADTILKENNYIDIVMLGEYEITLYEITQTILKSADLKEVKGIAFRKGNEIIITEKRELIDLDKLPWPARHFVNMYNYNDEFGGLPSPNVQILASRGCPYMCIFCNWPFTMYGGARYRVRNIKDIVDEVECLINKYKFKAFYFDDDTFNIGKERILKLCEEIKNRKLGVPWAAMARGDLLDREILTAMKDSGLYAIKFGVESGVQKLVDVSNKKLNLKKVIENTEIAKSLGIKVHLTFTFGLPGETKETIKETIEFAKKLDPESAQFSIVTPFPGTPYFKYLKENNLLLSENWEDYDGACNCVIRTEKLSRNELIKSIKDAQRIWTMHKFKTKILKNPFKYINKLIENPYKLINFIKRLIKG